jgi:hypothetical protein
MGRVLKIALATAAIGLVSMSAPASAADIVSEGLTYSLLLNSTTNGGKTGNFTLSISGVNVAGTDTRGGRTGIGAFAFGDPTVGDVTSGLSTGFTFQTGGLNASGCNGTGNFFCFNNSGYVLNVSPSGMVTLNFSATSNSVGSFGNWAPDFKIDWLGSANNYDNVSKIITVNQAVPEPATWAMMLVGFGGIGMAMRRRKVNVRFAQVA